MEVKKDKKELICIQGQLSFSLLQQIITNYILEKDILKCGINNIQKIIEKLDNF